MIVALSIIKTYYFMDVLHLSIHNKADKNRHETN